MALPTRLFIVKADYGTVPPPDYDGDNAWYDDDITTIGSQTTPLADQIRPWEDGEPPYRRVLYEWEAGCISKQIAELCDVEWNNETQSAQQIWLIGRSDRWYNESGWPLPPDAPEHIGLITGNGDYIPSMMWVPRDIIYPPTTDYAMTTDWWSQEPWSTDFDRRLQESYVVGTFIDLRRFHKPRHTIISPSGISPHG